MLEHEKAEQRCLQRFHDGQQHKAALQEPGRQEAAPGLVQPVLERGQADRRPPGTVHVRSLP